MNFPATLPGPDAEQFTETLGDGRIRTENDMGPVKVRRRYTAVLDVLEVAYHLTQTQAGTLRTFYRTDTKGGTLQFDYTHPVTGSTVQARFRTPPTFVPQGVDVLATFSVEILP